MEFGFEQVEVRLLIDQFLGFIIVLVAELDHEPVTLRVRSLQNLVLVLQVLVLILKLGPRLSHNLKTFGELGTLPFHARQFGLAVLKFDSLYSEILLNFQVG